MVEPRYNGPGDLADGVGERYDALAALAEGAPQRIERRFTTRINTLEEGWVSLTELDDDFHSMRVALRVGPDGVITEAAGRMLRNPFDTCPRAIESLSGLVGASVDGGVQKVVRASMPRSEGCMHIADMVGIALRAFSIARGHDMPAPRDDGRRREIMELLPFVRDTCASFAVEPE